MAFGALKVNRTYPPIATPYRSASPMAVPIGGFGALSDEATGAPAALTGRTPAMPAPPLSGDVVMPSPAADAGPLLPAMARGQDDRSILQRAIQDAPPAPSLGFLDRNSIDGVAIETRKPKAFEKGGVGLDILGTILDVVAGAGGAQGGYWAGKRRLADRERQDQLLASSQARQDAQRLQDRSWQVDDRNFKQNAPQYFNSGRDRVAFDPVTGEARTVYDAPEEYETYADTLGFSPEDDGYASAVQDYVLRGQGPTAMSARSALDRARQLDRIQLKGIPQARAPGARGGGGRGRGGGRPPSTASVMGGLVAKVANGVPLTPAEQRALDTYGPRRGGGGRGGGARTVPAGGPQAGAVENGYRFKGGDPADSKNWTKVR